MKPHSGGVLVGHAHQRLSEGLRGWLQASFDGVYMVADRSSLIEGAHRLQPQLLVVDLAFADGNVAALLAELHRQAPHSPALLLSDYDDASIDAAALAAGAAGADGGGGAPTDPAGAFADASVAQAAHRQQLDPHAFLADNDATGFFERSGGLLLTGPTLTNVNDLRAILVDS